jgi:hypothetical protein
MSKPLALIRGPHEAPHKRASGYPHGHWDARRRRNSFIDFYPTMRLTRVRIAV